MTPRVKIAELRADRWVLETAVSCKAPSLLCAAAGARVASYTTEITLYRRGDATGAFLLTKLSTIQVSDPVVARCVRPTTPRRGRAARTRPSTRRGPPLPHIWPRPIETASSASTCRRRRLGAVEAPRARLRRRGAGLRGASRIWSRRSARPDDELCKKRARSALGWTRTTVPTTTTTTNSRRSSPTSSPQGTSMVEIASKARGDGDQPLFGLAVVHLLLAADEREVDLSRIQQGD